MFVCVAELYFRGQELYVATVITISITNITQVHDGILLYNYKQ